MDFRSSKSVRRRALGGALAVVWSAFGQGAFAQEVQQEEAPPSDPVELRLRGCSEELTKERLLEILALELQTLQRESRPGRIDAQIICFPEAIVLSVSFEGGPSSDRRIEARPDSVPERSVALALSELVAEVWKGSIPAPEPPPPPPPRIEPPRPVPPVRVKSHALEAFVSLVSHAAPRRASPGAKLAYFHTPLRFFEWGLSARFDTGRVQDDVAIVRQWAVAIAPHVRLRLPVRSVVLAGGVSVPMGWVAWDPKATVEGAEEESLGAVWGAVLGELEVRVPFAPRFFATGGASMGGVFLPVRGLEGDRSLVEISGVLGALDLGVGILF